MSYDEERDFIKDVIADVEILKRDMCSIRIDEDEENMEKAYYIISGACFTSKERVVNVSEWVIWKLRRNNIKFDRVIK